MPAGSSRRVATPLDVKIEKLQMALERRDVDLESARDEARRLERERDLAERERDLEHQLHKIRTEMAAGGALGTAAARAAAGDAVSAEFRRDASKLWRVASKLSRGAQDRQRGCFLCRPSR